MWVRRLLQTIVLTAFFWRWKTSFDSWPHARLKFYYKYSNNLLPLPLQELDFKPNSSFHSYTTRYQHKLSVPGHKHSFFMKSLSYSIVSFINDLDHIVFDKIATHSLAGITTYYKNYLINRYDPVCNINDCYVCSSR